MAGEHMCHHPPHPDDIHGVGHNWCSPSPCPPTCTVNETYCPFMPPPGCMGDACMGADTCAPLSTGCPVHCNEGDKMCHMPAHSDPYMPYMPPMPAFNFCIPNNRFCPAACAEDEMNCPFMPPPGCMGDACMGPETCAPKSTGCPVHCNEDENMCHAPPMNPHDPFSVAMNWCNPKSMPCPVHCPADQLLCHVLPPPSCTSDPSPDACMGHDTCAPMSAGCPVTCMSGEHMCHSPPPPMPPMPPDVPPMPPMPGMNWCSPTPCPPTCTEEEIYCPFMPPPGCMGDACMGADTCAPKSAGCPITCMAGEHMCHT